MLRSTCRILRKFSMNPLKLTRFKKNILVALASKFPNQSIGFRRTPFQLSLAILALKKFTVASPLILGVALLPLKTANKDQFSKMLEEADSLYEALKYDELYELLVKHKDERTDGIHWRLARVTYRKSKSASSSAEKMKLLKEGNEYVKTAMEINPDNFAAHKWAAILIIQLAELEGTRAKLEQSVVSKEHMLKAHELSPLDATVLYLLGVWCFSFAELSWTQRKLATIIFATPPTSTFEEALEYFSRAESAEPNFYGKNLLMLGKTHLQLKDKENAIIFLKRARDYPLKTDDDKEASKEAAVILKSLGVS